MTVCEGDTAQLQCNNPGSTINIKSAWYGRNDRVTCPHSSVNATDADIPCGPGDTTLVTVRELCDGQLTCGVSANNPDFEDTCSGMYKYLEVEYTCSGIVA